MRKVHKWVLSLLLAGLSITLHAGEKTYLAAFWNVENLFDTVDEPLTRDEDFTPTGKYQWTEERLRNKFEHLAQVINEVNPDLLGLAEIENKAVLLQLVRGYLQRKNYAVIERDSPDERGIDCALIYDSTLFYLKELRFHPVLLAGGDRTREIVEAVLIPIERRNAPDAPRLYVFVNHWPSRWGGTKETDPKRRKAAAVLRARINVILQTHPAADILIVGDLNDHPDNASVLKVLGARPSYNKMLSLDLYNTTWPLHLNPDAGTYMHRGQWVVIDQIIISKGMLDDKGFSWVTNSTHQFLRPYLLQTSGRFKGWPFRMYAGGNYLGGYSDHLMVFCKIAWHY